MLKKLQEDFDAQYRRLQDELDEHGVDSLTAVSVYLRCIQLQRQMAGCTTGIVSQGHIDRAGRLASMLKTMVNGSPEILRKLQDLKKPDGGGDGEGEKPPDIGKRPQPTAKQPEKAPGGEAVDDSGWLLSSAPGTLFDDIEGMEDLKSRLISDLHTEPALLERYLEAGYVPENFYLLYGPPGTGKTMIAEAVAHFVSAAEPEAYPEGMKFYNIDCSHLLNKYVGESEKKVAQLFSRLRQVKNAVVFMDEFDSLCPDRGGIDASQAYLLRIVNLFLSNIGGINRLPPGIWLIAATNHPEKIDAGMISRFASRYYVPLPDARARAGMLRKRLIYSKVSELAGKPFGIEESLTIEGMAARLNLYSGRDISKLSDEIKRLLAERAHRLGMKGLPPITEEIFEAARKARPSSADIQMIRDIEEWGNKAGAS